MDQELFNPQSPSVTSSRILYTPSTFARTSLLHLQEVGSLQAVHQHTSTRTNLTSFLCFVVLLGAGSLTYEGMTYPLSAGDCVFIDCRKRTAILPRMIFGLFNGVTSMHRPFQLYMRNTRSVEVALCSTRRILNRSLHF